MSILITGGAGFIGSYLVDFYINLNKDVIVIDNLSTGKLQNISHHFGNDNFRFYQYNLLDWPDLEIVLEHCELVYHLAAVVGMFNVLENPIETLQTNIDMLHRLLGAISKLGNKPRIVIASSSEVYGSKSSAMKESEPILVESTNKIHANYLISKLCNEVAAMTYHKEKEVPAIVVRIFNTIGPRQLSSYGMVLPRFIQQAMHNKPITIFADGHQTRSFCDVRDMCYMLHQISNTDKSIGEIINVGSDKTISILKLANLVVSLVSSHSATHFQDCNEIYGTGYINIRHRKPDLNKLKSIIEYRLDWPLEKTIKDQWSYLKDEEQ